MDGRTTVEISVSDFWQCCIRKNMWFEDNLVRSIPINNNCFISFAFAEIEIENNSLCVCSPYTHVIWVWDRTNTTKWSIYLWPRVSKITSLLYTECVVIISSLSKGRALMYSMIYMVLMVVQLAILNHWENTNFLEHVHQWVGAEERYIRGWRSSQKNRRSGLAVSGRMQISDENMLPHYRHEVQ